MIAFQDIKDRMVYWILFPILGLFLGISYWLKSTPDTYFILCAANVVLVSCLLGILWVYTKLIRNTGFLNTTFGLGDVLFLYAFALGFPPVSFTILLSFSILFALLAHLVFSIWKRKDTIPLAGYMSLFLGVVFIWSILNPNLNLYLL